MEGFVYEIFKGMDMGMNKSPSDHMIAQFDTLNNALDCYKETQQECLRLSKEDDNVNYRYYCYMIEVDLDKRLVGETPDYRIVDSGHFSRTLYEHSYTQRPKKHDYMVNIENGKPVNFNKILDQHLYEIIL